MGWNRSTLETLRVRLARRAAPSANEVGNLLKKIEPLLSELKQKAEGLRADQSERLKLIEAEITKQRQKIPIKNGSVDHVAWQAKTEEERRGIGQALDGFFEELRCLNQDELRVGRRHFRIFFVLLLGVSLMYGALHKCRSTGSVDSAVISEVAKHLRSTELEIGLLIKAEAQGQKSELETLQKGIQAEIQALREQLKLGERPERIDLSFPTLQLLGMVESEADRGQITTDSFTRFSKVLLADLESLRSAFLWSDRRGRWFEITLWAEIGVLVGILFYIAGRLGQGRFASAEIAMFWTEAVIAPFVVLVIFFLFALTGITGVSPTETSITGNAGVAFIFGFAIRRTLGLLDIIKKRILPEPQPAS